MGTSSCSVCVCVCSCRVRNVRFYISDNSAYVLTSSPSSLHRLSPGFVFGCCIATLHAAAAAAAADRH